MERKGLKQQSSKDALNDIWPPVNPLYNRKLLNPLKLKSGDRSRSRTGNGSNTIINIQMDKNEAISLPIDGVGMKTEKVAMQQLVETHDQSPLFIEDQEKEEYREFDTMEDGLGKKEVDQIDYNKIS